MSTTAERDDPALWKKVKTKVQKGSKGGEAGEWSARKAQIAVAEYKRSGGGYKGEKRADNSLREWTREDWGTASGKPSGETHERYLPREAREHLSKDEYARTTAKKRQDAAQGRQFSAQPEDVAKKTAADREGHGRSGGRSGTTKAALYAEARRRNLPGRSTMSKNELERALR